MGRATGGVIGMKLRKGDEVIAIDVADDTADLLVITENRLRQAHARRGVPAQGPRTMGVLTIRLVEARGAIVGALVVGPRQEIPRDHGVRHGAAHRRPTASRRCRARRRA